MKKVEDCLETHGINFLDGVSPVVTSDIKDIIIDVKKKFFFRKVTTISIVLGNQTKLELNTSSVNLLFIESDEEESYAKYELRNSKKENDKVIELYLNKNDRDKLKDYFEKEKIEVMQNYNSELHENVFIL